MSNAEIHPNLGLTLPKSWDSLLQRHFIPILQNQSWPKLWSYWFILSLNPFLLPQPLDHYVWILFLHPSLPLIVASLVPSFILISWCRCYRQPISHRHIHWHKASLWSFWRLKEESERGRPNDGGSLSSHTVSMSRSVSIRETSPPPWTDTHTHTLTRTASYNPLASSTSES